MQIRVQSNSMSRYAWIAYNPAAGRFPSRMLTERAARVLEMAHWRTHLVQTRSGAHITELAAQAVRAGADVFIVVGGDGSLNHALPPLLHSQTALAVLPGGTANVWAQEIGLPGLTWTRWLALEHSARLLARGRIQAVDVGLCNGQPFLLWGGVGLDGFIVHRIEPRKPWEKHFAVLQYATAAVMHLPRWRGLPLRGEVDGQRIAGRFIMAVASNIRLYAGGLMAISPQARLDDGQMDLWLFAGDTPLDAARHAFDVWAGRHVASALARRIVCREFVLRSEEQLYLQLDGEPVQAGGEIRMQVQPQALRVLVPAEMPAEYFVQPALENSVSMFV